MMKAEGGMKEKLIVIHHSAFLLHPVYPVHPCLNSALGLVNDLRI
jgi:hypothetical protein